MKRCILVVLSLALAIGNAGEAAAQDGGEANCICGGVFSGAAMGIAGGIGILASYHRFMRPAYSLGAPQIVPLAGLLIGGVASGIEIANDGNLHEAWQGAAEGAAYGLALGGMIGLVRGEQPHDLRAGLVGGFAIGLAAGFFLEGLSNDDPRPPVAFSVSLPVGR